MTELNTCKVCSNPIDTGRTYCNDHSEVQNIESSTAEINNHDVQTAETSNTETSNTCRVCNTPIDIGRLYCSDHNDQGLLNTFVKLNTSQGITKFNFKRLIVSCPNCGFNLMLKAGYCFICQYDFEKRSIRIGKVLSGVKTDFLGTR